MNDKTVPDVARALRSNNVKINGMLEKVKTLKDGSVLIADSSMTPKGKVNHRFFSANDERIRSGFFKKGKFHFFPKSVILFS